MRRPDFILAGATRSGLNALSKILDRHPQIYIPQRTELQFFNTTISAKIALGTCMGDFTNAVSGNVGDQISENRVLRGEEEFDPTKAHKGAPRAKIIFTLRDPVDRSF